MKPETRAAALFLTPALVVLIVFFFIPVIAGFALSVTDFDLYSIGDIHPAMLRVDSGGAAIALEIWELPPAGFAQVLAGEPAGLCIGKVVLSDAAEEVLGVLGEPWLVARGTEITQFGGWRAYTAARRAR